MILVGKRKTLETIGEAAEEAALRSPALWAHRRAMKWFQRMNAIDAETARMMLGTIQPGAWHWISSIPQGVAAVINRDHPEIFNDSTGKAMQKFLASDAGAPYRVPKKAQHFF